jgi:hypothetical protein
MEGKKKSFLYSILIIILGLIISFTLLFTFYWSVLITTLAVNEGYVLVLGIIISRILILGIMSFFLYLKWLKQEAIYTSDAYFLFGSFFGILSCGKIYDIFYNLAHISMSFDADFILLLLKIRFFIIVVNVMPILYIGLEVIITFFNMYKNKEMDKKQFNKLRLRIILIFTLVLVLVICLAPTTNFLATILPFITLIMFLGIAIMFLFMYKNKRLTQANGLIIGIAFICFIVSNLIRAFLVGINVYYTAFAEVIDTGVNLLIFIGFVTKPKYAK